MPYSQLLGARTGRAILRVVGVCLAVLTAVFHLGAALYWLGIWDQLLFGLVSLLLGAISILAVVVCLKTRAALVAGAVGAVLAFASVIVLVLYSV